MCERHINPSFLVACHVARRAKKRFSFAKYFTVGGRGRRGVASEMHIPPPLSKTTRHLIAKDALSQSKARKGPAAAFAEQSAKARPGGASPEQSQKVHQPGGIFAEQSAKVLLAGRFFQSKAKKPRCPVGFCRAKRKSPAFRWIFPEQSAKVCLRRAFAKQSQKALHLGGLFQSKARKRGPAGLAGNVVAVSQSKVGKRRRRLIENYACFYLDFRARRSDGCAAPGRWDKPPPEGGTP